MFFFSGACGLIYEIVWTHELSLILGNTVYSLSAVLSSFMGGLALGSYLAGRATRRIKRPVLFYGYLEVLIGVYCALMPFIFDGAEIIYHALYNSFGTSFSLLTMSRFVINFIILIIPTTFMGATLPVLTEALLHRRQRLGFTAGSLYAFNTFGAVVGTLGAGFFLIPALGIQLTIFSTAAVNLILGLSAIFLDRKLIQATTHLAMTGDEKTERDSHPKTAGHEIAPKVVVVSVLVFGISGFAAMTSQVGWTRMLSLAVGSTVYAFSMIVAAFILGLAVGTSIAARKVDSRKDLGMTLALVQLGIGASCIIVLPVLGWSPLLFVELILKYSGSINWLLSLEFLVIAIVMLVPTLLMGATFPLVAKIYYLSRKQAGKAVGDVYAVNTIGAILGAFFVGFVLIPNLGIQKSLLLAAGLFSISGIVLFALSSARRQSRHLIVACVLLIIIPGGSFGLSRALESWDPAILSSGLYLLSQEKTVKKMSEKGTLVEALKKQQQDVKYYKEGLTATVAVIEQDGNRFLKIGGKTDATTFGDMPTQLLLAHVPMLLHSEPKKALVIGLGGGVTAGAVLTYPSVEQLDLVEISPEVIEAVRDYGFFDKVNGRPFQDQRLNLIVTDARNHAALTSSKYDVIISEPSNPWMAGMAMLFTKEHMENCRELLKPGGFMCQWLPAYRISKTDFLTVLATFASVFEYVSVWESIPGVDYLFLGSSQPQNLAPERIVNSLSTRSVRKDLSRLLISDLPTFLSYFLADKKQVRALIRGSSINTDDNMLLEYSAPRNIFNHSARTIPFNKIRQSSEFLMSNTDFSQQDEQRLLEQIQHSRIGRAWTLNAFRHRWRGELRPTLQALGKALTLNPADWNGRELEIKMRLEAARNSLQLGQFSKALTRLEKIQLLPGQPEVKFQQYKKMALDGLRADTN
ncbi:MAG: fused MFS/spermidine synthase [bacterium]